MSEVSKDEQTTVRGYDPPEVRKLKGKIPKGHRFRAICEQCEAIGLRAEIVDGVCSTCRESKPPKKSGYRR